MASSMPKEPSSIAEWSELFYSWIEKDGITVAHSNIRLKTILMIKRLPLIKEEDKDFSFKPLRERIEARRMAKVALDTRNKEAEDYRKSSEFLEIRALIVSSDSLCWSKTISFSRPVEERQVYDPSSHPSGEFEVEIEVEY